MTDDIRIRTASAADIEAMVGLVREYWTFEKIEGFDASRTAGSLRAFFANPSHGRAWIAETIPRRIAETFAAVGYLVACHVFSIEHGGLTAEIDEFFLLPSCRGAGLGRRLLEAAEASFRASELTNVSFEVGRHNDAARGFYRRLGYSDRSGYDRMEKNLPANPASKLRER